MRVLTIAVGVELLLGGVPVPVGELDRAVHQGRLILLMALPGIEESTYLAVHQVPDGAGAAQGLPRDEALPRDPLPRAEGEQAPGAAPPLR